MSNSKVLSVSSSPMMTALMIIIIIISVSSKVAVVVVAGESDRLTYTAVNITNKLSGENQVRFHCKSKDDDLGSRVLLSDESWDWWFRLNYMETTLYYCLFNSIDFEGYFDVYVGKRDKDRCRTVCDWEVKDDGLHGFAEKDPTKGVLFLPWPK